MSAKDVSPDRTLMKPGEVAELFDVDPKTVGRWAAAGRLTLIRTMGGHRRYLRHEVVACLQAAGFPTPAAEGTPES